MEVSVYISIIPGFCNDTVQTDPLPINNLQFCIWLNDTSVAEVIRSTFWIDNYKQWVIRKGAVDLAYEMPEIASGGSLMTNYIEGNDDLGKKGEFRFLWYGYGHGERVNLIPDGTKPFITNLKCVSKKHNR